MKKLILLAAITVILPKHQPMFDGMILRCDEQGKCHWECEFGVVTATTTVNENLLVKPSGCKKLEGVYIKSSPVQVPFHGFRYEPGGAQLLDFGR